MKRTRKVVQNGPVLLCAGGLALSVLPLRANLGETVQQLVKRYGSPTAYAEATAQSPFGRVMYKAGAYELVLFIQNNVEVGARVSKLDKSALTSDEITNILSNDTNGSPWIPVPSDNPNNTQWARADKAAVIYDKANHLLIFTSGEMMKTITAPLPPAQSGQAAPPSPSLPSGQPSTPTTPTPPAASSPPAPPRT